MTTSTGVDLFTPGRLGEQEIPNRILMAPLTRSRAKQPGDTPWELNAEYYRQRTSAGLIIAEATYVDVQGRGYAFIPGITNEDQVEGWRLVTDAVHGAGGRIWLQLFHSGRVGHPDLHGGRPPVAPSAIRAGTRTYTPTSNGMTDVAEPRALDADEIPGIIEQYRRGALLSKDAGFDGVEIHGANGYLLDQFTRDGTNQRTDAYGGDLERRLRVPLDVARAVAEVWGPGKVGYRVSPIGAFNDMSDSDPERTFVTLASKLGGLGLAYLHQVEVWNQDDGDDELSHRVRRGMRAAFRESAGAAGGGAFIANSGYTKRLANERLAADEADAVAFGTLFISNPDLPERFRADAPLQEADPATYYGGDERGYTDYPALETAAS